MIWDIKWQLLISQDNMLKFMEDLRLFYIRKRLKAWSNDDTLFFVSPLAGFNSKRPLTLIDQGQIRWEKNRTSEHEYWIYFNLSLKRAFFFYTFLPFFLVIFMFGYNYLSNPYFSWNWYKLLVLLLGLSGSVYFLYLKNKVMNYFNQLVS